MKLLLFGMLAEDIGSAEIQISMTDNVKMLREILMEQYPVLANRQYIIAVNQQKADEDIMLKEGDEIALIPPFAGG
jgi:molybdopterin synthase sulfur carrier subunit